MGTWYETFREHLHPIFNSEDFFDYKRSTLNDLKIYGKYIPPNGRVLDLGCGLGTTAVPLSVLGYTVTGIDRDNKVVEAARENAKNFGDRIEIIEGDIFDLNKIFEKDSYDACISGGVLEHFDKEDIRKLVDMQKEIAPVLLIDVPVKTDRTKSHYGFTESDALGHIDSNKIYRNFWSEDEWVNDILHGCNIVEHSIAPADTSIGDFDMLYIVIKRN